MLIGYSRLTTGPKDDRDPVSLLKEAGCASIFTDSAPATAGIDLPQRTAAAAAAKGKTLVVCGLDLLGVSLIDSLRFVKQLADDGTKLVLLEEGIDTTKKITFVEAASLIVSASGVFRSEAVGVGLEEAKKRGAKFGRKNALSSKDIKAAVALIAGGESVATVAEQFNVGESTMYRYKQEHDNQ